MTDKTQTIIPPSDVAINVAVYMERLDSYISGQSRLNKTLVQSVDKLNTKVNDLQDWKHQVHGAKAGSIAVGVLIFHTVLILGAMTGLVSWANSR